MITKSYFLFGIRIWTVVHEGYTLEEEEEEVEVEDSGTLSAATSQPSYEAPDFGFTPFTPHWITEEEED